MDMTTRRRSIALGIALALAAVGGCKQGDRAASQPPAVEPEATVDPAQDPSGMSAAEAERGRQACRSYVAQVCSCAEKDAELASECDMARARPQALEMSLRSAVAEGNATDKDRRSIQANAEQIARACIEDAAALVKRGCAAPRSPRSAPAPPPEPEPAGVPPDQTR
jgi:hypothetical protein